MEPSSTSPPVRSAWRLRAQLLGVGLLLVAGPWIALECTKPSRAEANQMRAEFVIINEHGAAGRLREGDHAGLDHARKWERYLDLGDPLRRRTHAELDAFWDDMEERHAPEVQKIRDRSRQSAARFLSNVSTYPRESRSLVLPTVLAIAGLALLLSSYR